MYKINVNNEESEIKFIKKSYNIKYVSLTKFNDNDKKMLIIDFKLNMKDDEFNKLKLNQYEFNDITTNVSYIEIEKFLNEYEFDKYFSENFNMNESDISMFREVVIKFRNLVEAFLISNITLYIYMMSIDSIQKSWNEVHNDFIIEGFTGTSMKIKYMKYKNRRR